MTTATLEDIRHAESANPYTPRAKDYERTWTDEKFRYWWIEGHMYRSLDKTAGLRRWGRYVWLGGNKLTITDRLTGGRLVDHVVEAGQNEDHAHPETIERMRRVTGRYPAGVAADRGFSLPFAFEYNTRHVIASAFDWRKDNGRPNQERADTDTELYDRHGVPRCQHCGGPGDITAAGLGLKFDRKQDPYLAFRCMLGHTTECAQTQSIQCSENWTLLVPLSRMTEEYHQLAHGRKPAERTHHHARQRYAVAGKGTAGKLKRKGLPAQQLRCDASLVIEWFRILIRQGWLDGERALNASESVPCKGTDRLTTMRRSRMKYGLNLPYGPAAAGRGSR